MVGGLLVMGACGDGASTGHGLEATQTSQALTAVPPGTRPSIQSLSSNQRTRLASAIIAFITQPILTEHANAHDWHHPANGELFFIRHHDYLNKLESYLSANGLGEFVPLPYWNPGTSIPTEFLVTDPLVTQASMNANPNQPVPSSFNDLCSFPNASTLAEQLEVYHNGVHTVVGGAMGSLSAAPGAPIFWLWHGFLDDMYHTYEGRCENRKDFDRDVHADVLWHNVSTGDVGVWFLDGTTVLRAGNLSWQAAESTGWQVKGTGDFNGDGRTDVLWHNPGTGEVSVWFLNGTSVIGSENLAWQVPGNSGWELKGTGDFDRDGHIDLLWHNPGTGVVGVWNMSGASIQGNENLTWNSQGTDWKIVSR